MPTNRRPISAKRDGKISGRRNRQAPAAQPQEHRRALSARCVHRRHRRERFGQEFARQRGAVQHAGPQAASRRTTGRAHDEILGLEQIDKVINVDQDPIGNSPIVQPGDVHRRLRPDPPAVRPAARVEGPRLPAAALQLQQAGRPLRGVRGQRARRRSRCTSCPMSGSSATSATAAATTPRRWPSSTRASPSPTC